MRSLAYALTLLAFVISTAQADDSPITFVRPLKSAPKGAEVFFGIPRDLDPEKKITVVVYFHGLLGDEKFEDTLTRQRVAAQVADAHVNAVIVAPSIDYSTRLRCAGKKKKKRCKKVRTSAPFAEKGSFKKFLSDSRAVLAKELNAAPGTLAAARIVIIGYSAGHRPIRAILARNDLRLDGVVLLDAHYGSQKVFAKYAARLARSGAGFFLSAHSPAQDERDAQFEDALSEEDVVFVRRLPDGRLLPGLIVVIKVDDERHHRDFVTSAWTEDPVTEILAKAYGILKK